MGAAMCFGLNNSAIAWVLAMGMVSTPLLAAGVIKVEQIGSENWVEISQASHQTLSCAEVSQIGEFNSVVVTQSGQMESALISQLGRQSVAVLLQSGISGTASVSQQGDMQSTDIFQAGADNISIVSQENQGNSANILQYGTGDYVSITQPGAYGLVNILQTAAQNSAIVLQTGFAPLGNPNSVDIIQNTDGANIVITQIGDGGGRVVMRQ